MIKKGLSTKGVFILSLLLLIILQIINVQGATPNLMQSLTAQFSSMNEKCVIGLRGVQCDGQLLTKASSTSSPNNNNNNRIQQLIVAGVGYSKFKHEIKPAILKSPIGTKFETVQTAKFFSTIKTANEYFSLLYPSESTTLLYNNGMYSHSINNQIDVIFSNYFKGEFNLFNSQLQYLTHQVNINEIQVTNEFLQIIDILPNELDRDLYTKVIEYFGDSILVNIKYGGLIDLTQTIKSCYKDSKMLDYVNQNLDLISLGVDPGSKLPNSFIRYQNINQLDILGGNPQIDNTKNRIASFIDNPVPIQFNTIPIWRAFPNGAKQNNMKIIYNEYISNQARNSQNLINSLEERLRNDKLRPQQFYIFKKELIIEQAATFDLATSNSLEVNTLFRLDCAFPSGRQLTRGETHQYYYYYKPIITRNGEGNFNVKFNYGTCLKRTNQCTWSTSNFQSVVFRNGFERSLDFTSPNKCVQIVFPEPMSTRCTTVAREMFVCAGCMPIFDGSRTSLTCECPFVK